MVLVERETLNLALEALREKLALPKEMVILKEKKHLGNREAISCISRSRIKGNFLLIAGYSTAWSFR